ncbi:hypothetical protein ACS0PU_000487 [Formica fusca]
MGGLTCFTQIHRKSPSEKQPKFIDPLTTRASSESMPRREERSISENSRCPAGGNRWPPEGRPPSRPTEGEIG